MTPKFGLGKSSTSRDEQALFRMHEKEVRVFLVFLVFLEKENYTQISKLDHFLWKLGIHKAVCYRRKSHVREFLLKCQGFSLNT